MKIGSVLATLGIGIIIPLLGLATTDLAKGTLERQLILASIHNDLPRVRTLVKQGTNINFQDPQGRTALLAAVEENHIEIAKVLIDAGADVNIQDNKLDSPFLLAGAEGRLEMLQLMLHATPNFNLYNRFGGTALIPACERGHVEVVKVLLKTEVAINHVNHLGWTALLEAIILSDGGPSHQQIVQMLVDAGADVNMTDNEGATPLHHAQKRGFKEIVAILQNAGL